jgi:PAS domain S-box-containing protein
MPPDPRRPESDPSAAAAGSGAAITTGFAPRLLGYILHSAPQSIFWKDRDGIYLGCNRAFARAVGLASPDQIVGKTDFDLPWPRAEAEAYRAGDRKVMTLGVPDWHLCEPLQQADGTRLWIDITKVPLRDDLGAVVGVLGIYEDITESRRTQQALHESERMLQLVLDTIPARVFWKSVDLEYRGGNRLFAADAGLAAPGALIGKTDFDLAWRDLAERYRADDRAVIETGRPKIGYEEPQTNPEGRQIWLRTSKIPLRDDQGATIGVLGTYEDITERKLTEQALRDRLGFEALISAISTRFIDLRPEEIDAGVQEALQQIGQFTAVDRSYVFLLRDDGRTMDNTHEWCSSGVETHRARLQGLPICDFPSVGQTVLRGEAAIIERVRDLGPEHAVEKAEFVGEGIKSLALVPMSCRGVIIGFLGLDCVREERTFDADGIALLRIAGECLANGLERRRYDESLRNSETRLRSIFRASPVGIGLVSSRVLLEVNERICEMTGYTRAELVGQNARLLYPTQAEFEFVGREKYAQIHRTGVGTVETHWRRKDGSLLDVLMSSVPLDPDDLTLGVTFTALDITDRKRAAEALHAAVEGTAGATGDAFFPTLVRCLAQALNVRHAFVGRLTGESPRRLETISAWLDGRFVDNVTLEIDDAACRAAAGEAHVFDLAQARDAFSRSPLLAGRQIEFFGGACLRDSADHPIGILAVMDDGPREQASLTESLLRIFSTRAAAELERMRSEEERRRLEAQVQHVQKLESLGVLAGGIAHDFNNLLMAILGNADLACRALAPESPGQAYLQDIETAARRAADLCRQMLAYSGKGRFIVEPVSLDEIILEMTRMLEVSISKKASLRYDLDRALPAVAADATQIRQIVMNLITNASEALGDRSGVIAIATGTMECDRTYLDSTYLAESIPEGTYVWLEISDTGAGMTPEVRARMFDPFFSTKFTGRGLGMAAVLGIVRGHRGGVRVYSEPGQGTTIRVFFPASPEAAIRKQELKAADADWRGTGTVLVVDDDETVCALACRMLAMLGFATVVAGDGRRALEVYGEHRGDIVCVLLDLTMPHMDGAEAFHALRRLDSNARVIMSSGYNEQEVTRRFHGEGLAGFIQKPYLFAALRDTMRAVMTSPTTKF